MYTALLVSLKKQGGSGPQGPIFEHLDSKEF